MQIKKSKKAAYIVLSLFLFLSMVFALPHLGAAEPQSETASPVEELTIEETTESTFEKATPSDVIPESTAESGESLPEETPEAATEVEKIPESGEFPALAAGGEEGQLSTSNGLKLMPLKAEENIASGEGWYLGADGCLHITGAVTGGQPWADYSYQIVKAVAESGSSIDSGWKLFNGCMNMVSADLRELDTSSVTDMSDMFRNCSGLTTLDLSTWDTSSVTNMSDMFGNCSGLTTLDMSTWDTSSVTDMRELFANCSGLTTLDVSTWDTSSVTDMSGMFWNCSGLTTLDLSTWDTSSVTDMDNMFFNCSGLTTLDVSTWDLSHVTNMGGLFHGCSGLTTLDLSTWDTSSVIHMECMFRNCSGLTSLDLSSWNTSNECHVVELFFGCYDLQELTISDGFNNSAKNTSFFTIYDTWVDKNDSSVEFTSEQDIANNNQTRTIVRKRNAPPEPAGGDLAIPVIKIVTGDSAPVETFTFKIEAKTTGAPMPDNVLATISGEGTAYFDQIHYPSAGRYEYSIREVAGTSEQYTYDSSVYIVTVDVKNTDDGLSAGIVAIRKDGASEKSEAVTFNNIYTKPLPPTPKYGSLKLSKTVTGALADMSKAFSFHIVLSGTSYNENGFANGVKDVTLKHGENITISNIPAGTTYTITEQGSEAYTTTVDNNGTPVEGKEVSGTITADTEAAVVYTNDLPYTPAVGIHTDAVPFILLGFMGLSTMAYMAFKKRHA